jgi:hypothetical protein
MAKLFGGGGTKITMPEPIDPGESALKYIEGITDPVLQQRIIQAERIGRPQFAGLELADIATFARGLPAGEYGDPQYDAQARRVRELEQQLSRTKKTTRKKVGKKSGRSFRQTRYETQRNPEYAAIESQLNLARSELARMSPMETREAIPGIFDLLEEQAVRSGALQREQLQLQRESDVGALQEFAPQVVEAYRAADPLSAELADLAQQQAVRLFGEAEGELSPERSRMVQQAAREASLARGRIGDESSVAAEVLGREQFKAGLRQEARQAGLGAFQQQRQIAGDIGMTLLGRPSAAIGLGGQMLGQAQGLAAQPIGPQLFDPNVGINMALQQRGQQMELMGAQAEASAGRSAGMMGMLGSLGAAAITACWVAREVYGVENPKWLQFREWMLNDAPAWFRNLYIKFGERFAGFISNKPGLKLIIRKWMDTKIK